MGKYQLLPFQDVSSPCCFRSIRVCNLWGQFAPLKLALSHCRESAATVVQQIGVSRGMGCGLKI